MNPSTQQQHSSTIHPVIGRGLRPKLAPVFMLRCPYCAKEPLRQKGSWFEFAEGCCRCRYRYERELGYYTGASWMINFPITASLAFLLVVALVAADLALKSTHIAMIVTIFIFAVGILIFPYAQALWLYLEHRIRPLTVDDDWPEAGSV
ncbi:MAG: hypothetical protein ACOH5I_07285 [Oligoflexus sp.]